jgi:hypothetical protein
MPRRPQSAAPPPAERPPAGRPGEWLLIVQHLPAGPSHARVKTWRRLQEIGAVAIRNAVYVLPHSAQSREDFAWIRQEILAMQGQATVFVADAADEGERREIVEAFRAARSADYAELAKDVSRVSRRLTGRGAAAGGRRPEIAPLRQWLRAIEAIDFFSAPGGDEVRQALAQLESRMARKTEAAGTPLSAARSGEYQGRVWVTRARPGVDRMSSAWLIRTFIDRAATFVFAKRDETPPPGQVPFDMYAGEFSHQGGRCTFEVLAERFAIDDRAVRRIADIVHDVDLKDAKYQPPEAATIAALVEGIRQAHADDAQMLQHGMAMFDALYRSFEASTRPAPPARRRPARTGTTTRRSRR